MDFYSVKNNVKPTNLTITMKKPSTGSNVNNSHNISVNSTNGNTHMMNMTLPASALNSILANNKNSITPRNKQITVKSSIKTTHLNMTGSNIIPKPNAVKNYVSATPKSKINMTTALKSKTAGKSP